MMDIEGYVAKNIGRFRKKGNELQLYYCPFCGGGRDRQKFTFSVNAETGAYNCLRLNNCGVRGSLHQLIDEFGGADIMKAARKQYKPPTKKVLPCTDKVVEWFEKERRINKKTLAKFKVGSNGGNVAMFPFYDTNGKLVMTKGRDVNDKKSMFVDGYCPILFGFQSGYHKDWPLVITEGEIDAMTVCQCLDEHIPRTSSMSFDVASMPSGASNLEFIDLCWEQLKGRKIILWGDNDSAGMEAMLNIFKRLGNCSWVLSEKGKDANEVYIKHGGDTVIYEILNSEPMIDDDVIDASDVVASNIRDIESVPTGFPHLDRIVGGARMGEITILTGYNSSGKTTILNALMLNAIDNGYGVCAYSGEFSPDRLTSWIDQQAAGRKHLRREYNEKLDMDFFSVDPVAEEMIKLWYAGKLFFYSPKRRANVRQEILEKFQYAYNRFGCKVFVVDNLLKVLSGTSSAELNSAQTEFIDECTSFAHDNGVHIYIVAHPKKTQGFGRLSRDDISGTFNISNLADVVMSIHRVTRKDRDDDWYKGMQTKLGGDFDATIEVMKNRFLMQQDVMIPLMFDPDTRRYSEKGDTREVIYGWERAEQFVIEFDE